MALLIGIVGYGYTSAVNALGQVDGLFVQVADVQALRIAAVIAPIVGLAGAGMVVSRALWGGLLMLASVGAMYFGFGLNGFTLFPMCFSGVAALLALAAGRPDEAHRHF
ncbi:hypothetical protein [Pseudooceanicola sediminis]|nr:hypothetical protein [Pseudooceanicola sediminis]